MNGTTQITPIESNAITLIDKPAPRARPPAKRPTATDPAELSDSFMNFIARAARDPSIDVGKLEALIRMQRDIADTETRRQTERETAQAAFAYTRALRNAQAEIQPVARDAQNDQTRSRYARLETVDAAIRPIYSEHGFTLEFGCEPLDGPNIRVFVDVSHCAPDATRAHTKRFHLEAAPDTAGAQGKTNKTALHGLASTITYLRRYLTCLVFNVVTANEDNDGNRPPPPRDDGELASRARTDELYRLLAACSADPQDLPTIERKFLKVMGLETTRSLKDIPPDQYTRLRTALLAKKSKIEAANAAAGAATTAAA
jgi:hypothetical protein